MPSQLLCPQDITARDGLLIIDMQNDFMPGGPLPVPGGPALVPGINQLSLLDFRAVIATQDWHPAGHCSFREQGGPWPAHCCAGTRGAALLDGLDQRRISHIIRKGTAMDADSNSAFQDDAGTGTGLTPMLRGLGITRLFLCGVALDVCVFATARHAVQAGFETCIIQDASAGIDVTSAFFSKAKAGHINFTSYHNLLRQSGTAC